MRERKAFRVLACAALALGLWGSGSSWLGCVGPAEAGAQSARGGSAAMAGEQGSAGRTDGPEADRGGPSDRIGIDAGPVRARIGAEGAAFDVGGAELEMVATALRVEDGLGAVLAEVPTAPARIRRDGRAVRLQGVFPTADLVYERARGERARGRGVVEAVLELRGLPPALEDAAAGEEGAAVVFETRVALPSGLRPRTVAPSAWDRSGEAGYEIASRERIELYEPGAPGVERPVLYFARPKAEGRTGERVVLRLRIDDEGRGILAAAIPVESARGASAAAPLRVRTGVGFDGRGALLESSRFSTRVPQSADAVVSWAVRGAAGQRLEYAIDWGDGVHELFEAGGRGERSHRYGRPGAYTVSLAVRRGNAFDRVTGAIVVGERDAGECRWLCGGGGAGFTAAVEDCDECTAMADAGCGAARVRRRDCEPVHRGRDGDGDGFADGSDNCPAVANPRQADHNGDGLGDPCDPLAVLEGEAAPLEAMRTLFELHQRAPRGREAASEALESRLDAEAAVRANLGEAQRALRTAVGRLEPDDHRRLAALSPLLELAGDDPEIFDGLVAILSAGRRADELPHDPSPGELTRHRALALILHHARAGSDQAKRRLLEALRSPHEVVRRGAVRGYYAVSTDRRRAQREMRSRLPRESHYLIYEQ